MAQRVRTVDGKQLTIWSNCRDCRQLVKLKFYDLREMYGKPVVCKGCAEKLDTAVKA